MARVPFQQPRTKVVPPKRDEMKRSMEALIHHFKLYTEGFHVPAARFTPPSSRPRASSASTIVSDGGTALSLASIRAPGFPHLQPWTS